MAAGYLISSDPLAGESGQNIPAHPPAAPLGVIADSTVVHGPKTASAPAHASSTSAGYYIRDWQPDYFDRLLIAISNASFGTVAGPVQRTLTITNMYRVPKSVTAQGAVGASGVSILAFPALPFDIAPVTERSWTLEASPVGDPIITGYLTFVIDAQSLVTPTLSGIRAIILSHEPTWQGGVDVERGFSDVIDEAISLAEKRESRGDVALLKMRFTVLTLTAQESSSLARLLELARSLPVGVPVWSDWVVTTAGILAGATSLPVTETTNRKFTTARPFVMLWAAWDNFVVVEATAIAANTITVAAGGVLADWPAGTRVVPLRFGKINVGSTQKRETDRVKRQTVEFTEYPI